MGFKNNFDNVKVGDTVILHSTRHTFLKTVVRVTNSYFDIGDGHLYSKKNGDARGFNSMWEVRYCTVASEEDILRIKEQKEREALIIKIDEQMSSIKNSTAKFTIDELNEFSTLLSKYTSNKSNE